MLPLPVESAWLKKYALQQLGCILRVLAAAAFAFVALVCSASLLSI